MSINMFPVLAQIGALSKMTINNYVIEVGICVANNQKRIDYKIATIRLPFDRFRAYNWYGSAFNMKLVFSQY